MTELVITVYGDPAPQGSKTVFGRNVVESSKRVRPWREAVAQAVAAGPRIVAFGERVPVEVVITFWLPRPRSHYGTGRNASALRGDAPEYPVAKQRDDIDKLCRATLDALSGHGIPKGCPHVLDDDSQVAVLTAVKLYAGNGREPGARITVRTVDR